jgi:hypothetical protein
MKAMTVHQAATHATEMVVDAQTYRTCWKVHYDFHWMMRQERSIDIAKAVYNASRTKPSMSVEDFIRNRRRGEA